MPQSEPSSGKKVRFVLNSAMLPAIGVALLPKLFCPACWPAYAGLFSSLGIGFVNYTPWLLPLTITFVLIALSTLLWRASQRQGYKPFLLGLVASLVLVIGKFAYSSDIAMYAGLVLLVTASVWNTLPGKADAKCGKCTT